MLNRVFKRCLMVVMLIYGASVFGQGNGLGIAQVIKENFPVDSVQIYRRTFRITFTGKGKIKEIISLRIEDFILEFDKPEKKIRIKSGVPLTMMVSQMENRRSARTEYMHTVSYGTTELLTNLYVLYSERQKDPPPAQPVIEFKYKSGKKEKTVTVAGYTEIRGEMFK